MREILFRGKRADNGEWVEGQLLFFKASVGTEAFALIVESCEWDNANEWFNLGKRAKVIPETIGQFTGLIDKNGKKIFEGDILKGKHNWHSWNHSSDNTEEEFFAQKIRGAYGKHKSEEYALFDRDRYFYYRNYAVEYYAKNGGYRVRNGGQFHALTQSYIYNRDLEIIGNIHDNPELLKGGEAE